MLDNDEAGLNGTISIGEELVRNNLPVEVIRLSEEKDPDSYIIRFGPEKFKDLLKRPQSFFEFKLQYLKSNKDLNKSKDLANYINSVIDELNKSDDDILKEVTINKICTDYNLDKEILLRKLIQKEKVINPQPIVVKKTIPKLNKYQKICEAIIYMMMKNLKYLKKYDRSLGYIPDKKYNQIANDILAYYKLNQDFNMADFISFEIKSAYYDIVLRIINQYEEMEPNYEEFDDYLEAIKKWIKEEQINKLKEEIDKETDINRQIELNDLLMKLKKESE